MIVWLHFDVETLGTTSSYFVGTCSMFEVNVNITRTQLPMTLLISVHYCTRAHTRNSPPPPPPPPPPTTHTHTHTHTLTQTQTQTSRTHFTYTLHTALGTFVSACSPNVCWLAYPSPTTPQSGLMWENCLPASTKWRVAIWPKCWSILAWHLKAGSTVGFTTLGTSRECLFK